MGRNARWIALAATAVLAACGGTTPTSGPGGATAGPATAGSGSQPTTAPIATPDGGPGGGPGDGFTGNPCSLLTAAELEAATGVTNAVGIETPIQNGSGACAWSGDEATLAAAISVTTGSNANMVWETWKTQAGSEALSGIGDGAVYVPSAGTVFLIKGSTLIGLQAGPFTAEPDVKKENGIELAKVIAGRL